MIPNAQAIISFATHASELVLLIATLAFVRLYFVPEYGFFAFWQREKGGSDCTIRLLLFSAEHVAPLEPPVFRICLRSAERIRMNVVNVYAGAWLNKSATMVINASTGKELSKTAPSQSERASDNDVELVLVLRGMAAAGAVRIAFEVTTPDSSSGEVPVDVDVYSVSGSARKSAAEVVKERAGLPVRRFDVKSRKFGRTPVSLVLGVAIAVSTFVYARLVFVPAVFGREAAADKFADLSAWDVGLVLALFVFALEFAVHRLAAGYPFRATACGYREASPIWQRTTSNNSATPTSGTWVSP